MDGMGGKHPWLFERGGRWYLRARVPKDVPNFGKAEVKWALGTSDRREASRLIHAAAAELTRQFDQYRQHGGPPPKRQPTKVSRLPRAAKNPSVPLHYRGEGPPPPQLKSSETLTDAELRSFAAEIWREWQGWILAPLPNSDPDWVREQANLLEADRWEAFQRPLGDGDKTFPVGTAIFLEQRGFYFDKTGQNALILSDYISRAGSEAYRQKIERLRGVSTFQCRDRLFDEVSVNMPQQASFIQPSAVSRTRKMMTLSQVIAQYEDDPTRQHIEQKTRQEDRRTFSYMREFFGTDAAISEITRQECIAFRSMIVSIPKNAFRDFNGLTLNELKTVAAERSLPRLSNKGVNKYVHKLSAVMNFAKDNEWIPTSPAYKIAMPAKHSIDD